MNTKTSGDWGESQVAAYLCRRGFRIVTTKYRCRFGEIDLIARDGDMLCFVEVKLRRNTDYGLPREYVTSAKQRRLRKTAEWYISCRDPEARCRFDVAEVYPDPTDLLLPPRIVYLEDAVA